MAWIFAPNNECDFWKQNSECASDDRNIVSIFEVFPFEFWQLLRRSLRAHQALWRRWRSLKI